MWRQYALAAAIEKRLVQTGCAAVPLRTSTGGLAYGVPHLLIKSASQKRSPLLLCEVVIVDPTRMHLADVEVEFHKEGSTVRAPSGQSTATGTESDFLHFED